MSSSFLPSPLSPSSSLSPFSTMVASPPHISTAILTTTPSPLSLSSPRFTLLPDFSSPSPIENRRANVVSTATYSYRCRIRHHYSSMSIVPRISSCRHPPPSSSSFSDSSCYSVSLHNGSHGSEEVYSDSEEDGDADVDSDDDEEDDIEEREDSTSNLPDRWDVLGLGQAMVDFSGVVDDKFLEKLVLEKGTRKIVNHEERGRVLRAMDGCSYKAAAGGSLSNSLVALARLGAHSVGGHPLNIAMAGSVGSDPLGGFFRAKLHRANVNFLSPPVKNGTTGTVIVLTTPDAHRTMLAYQGTSSSVDYDPYLASIISKASILVVEGYLFEFPNTIKTIVRACKDAHRTGALVAITASDVTCIQRHYDDFWEVIENHADIVFANSDEARAFCDFSPRETPVSAARYLSHFVPLISVTDGRRGSYIGIKGEAVYIPPSPCAPVDTCGAGDAYASGILYGVLRGMSDLKGMGSLAAKVAAVVVGQQGTRLRVQDAARLAEDFALQLDGSMVRSDVGSDQISSL